MGRYKEEFNSSSGIRKLLISIYMKLDRGEIDDKRATTMSNVLYKVLATIQEDRKADEVEALQEIEVKLDKLGG